MFFEKYLLYINKEQREAAGKCSLPPTPELLVRFSSVPFTLDVVNIFTNIPWDKGTEACGHFWDLLRLADYPGHPVDSALVVRVGLFVLSHVQKQEDPVER